MDKFRLRSGWPGVSFESWRIFQSGLRFLDSDDAILLRSTEIERFKRQGKEFRSEIQEALIHLQHYIVYFARVDVGHELIDRTDRFSSGSLYSARKDCRAPYLGMMCGSHFGFGLVNNLFGCFGPRYVPSGTLAQNGSYSRFVALVMWRLSPFRGIHFPCDSGP